MSRARWPRRVEMPIRDMDDAALLHLSKSGQLSMSLPEMKAVQARMGQAGMYSTALLVISVLTMAVAR